MRYTRLETETTEYQEAREELRLAEIELLDHTERIAQMRRALPPGGIVQDYEFLEGDPAHPVRMSELFTSSPARPLVVYHFMYGKAQTSPCPMCTLWIDGFNGVARHLAQHVDFVVVAAADLPALHAHAHTRGWDQMRMLSAGDNTFKYDLGSEDEAGNQDAQISVFVRDGDSIRHTYSATAFITEDKRERGIDALCAVWNVLDITPGGRGDWYAGLDY